MTPTPLRASPETARLLGATKRIADPGVFPQLFAKGLARSNPGHVVILAFDRSIWLWPRVREAT